MGGVVGREGVANGVGLGNGDVLADLDDTMVPARDGKELDHDLEDASVVGVVGIFGLVE